MASLNLSQETLTFLTLKQPIRTYQSGVLAPSGTVIAVRHNGWSSGGPESDLTELVFDSDKGIRSIKDTSSISMLLSHCRRPDRDETPPAALCAALQVTPEGAAVEKGSIVVPRITLSLAKGMKLPAGTHLKCYRRTHDSISVMYRDARKRLLRCQLGKDAIGSLAVIGHAGKCREAEASASGIHIHFTSARPDEGVFLIKPEARSCRFEPGPWDGSIQFASQRARDDIERSLAVVGASGTQRWPAASRHLLAQYPPSAEDYLEYLTTTQGLEPFSDYLHALYAQMGVAA